MATNNQPQLTKNNTIYDLRVAVNENITQLRGGSSFTPAPYSIPHSDDNGNFDSQLFAGSDIIFNSITSKTDITFDNDTGTTYFVQVDNSADKLQFGFDTSLFNIATEAYVDNEISLLEAYVDNEISLLDNRYYTQSEIDAFIQSSNTVAPIVTSQTVSLNEGGDVDIGITNYEEELDYTVESLDTSVATVSWSGDTLTITGQSVSSDQTVTVRLNAKGAGLSISNWTEISATVNNVPVVADNTIQVTDFSGEALINDQWSFV